MNRSLTQETTLLYRLFCYIYTVVRRQILKKKATIQYDKKSSKALLRAVDKTFAPFLIWLELSIVLIGISLLILTFQKSSSFILAYHEPIKSVGIVLAGTAGLLLAFSRTNSLAKQADIAKQGLDEDSFGRAVDQLGHKAMSVRVGGIFFLWMLKERNQDLFEKRVIETLCAFIRRPFVDNAHSEQYNCNSYFEENCTPSENKCRTCSRYLREDVKAALTLLCEESNNTHFNLDLTGSRLGYANFEDANLDTFILTGCDLRNCKFKRCHGTNIKFIDCNLGGVVFYPLGQGAKIRFDKCQFDKSDLRFGDITSVHFLHGKITNSLLGFGQCEHVNFNSLSKLQIYDSTIELSHFFIRNGQRVPSYLHFARTHFGEKTKIHIDASPNSLLNSPNDLNPISTNCTFSEASICHGSICDEYRADRVLNGSLDIFQNIKTGELHFKKTENKDKQIINYHLQPTASPQTHPSTECIVTSEH